MPYQSELEGTSVMTRSASRKYATVGALHNRVDFDKELKLIKQWPTNISYSAPKYCDDSLPVKDLVTKSFKEVLNFCKNAVVPEHKEIQIVPEEDDIWKPRETASSFIDLSPYITQEPVLMNGSDETHITLHLNDNCTTHPYVNIISLNEEDQSGTLVTQEENEVYETITLHSGETYLVDDKYFSNSNSTSFSSVSSRAVSHNIFSDDAMMGIQNDHTYAAKYTEEIPVKDKKTTLSLQNEEDNFKLENSLHNLLLNTAILKCLICNETPQEIITQLEMARL